MRYMAGVCAAALLVASCAQDGSGGLDIGGEELGTAGGAVVGGLVGSQIGSGTGQLVATGAGAVAGALIGRELGQYLEEQDQEKLAEATANTAATGDSQKWNNPDTGVSGKTEVVKSEEKTEAVSVSVKKDRVEEVPPMELIGQPYTATAGVNVRGGPSTDYKKVGFLSNGNTVNVAGKVEGRSWYMISQNGAGQGFVHSDYLQQAQGTKLADKQESGTDGGNVTEKTVNAKRQCRTVEQTVTLESGETKNETVEACRGPNGWEVQA